jgi:glycosyltransferase involved in cell wall biosynthesis
LYGSPKDGLPWQTVFPATFCLGKERGETPNSKLQTLEKLQAPSSNSQTSAGVEIALNACGEFKPDLIYVHKVQSLDVFGALLGSGVPVVRMVHDHEMYCLRQYKYNPLTRTICTRAASGFCIFPCLAPLARNRGGRLPFKWASFLNRRREMQLSRQCEKLIVYSEYSKAELIRNGFDANRIHLHVPIRCWGSEGPISSFSPRNLVLFAGQIIRGKGVDLLLQALSKLTAPFECLILGDGSHRAQCEKLCQKLRLEDRVKFVGHVPHDQMRQYYLEASVLAMPSVWPEPFGMAGPEAMRYGLPVVAFDAGGIKEWLHDGHNGFLAPWMDTSAFAAHLQILLANKGLARTLGQNGMASVNRAYDSRSQAGRLEQLFRDTLKEGPSAPQHRSSPTGENCGGTQLFKVSAQPASEPQEAVSLNAL